LAEFILAVQEKNQNRREEILAVEEKFLPLRYMAVALWVFDLQKISTTISNFQI